MSRLPLVSEIENNVYQIREGICDLTGEPRPLAGLRVRVVGRGGMVGDFCVILLDSDEQVVERLRANLADDESRDWWTSERIDELVLAPDARFEFMYAELRPTGERID